ncbi:MAG: tRNA guanosine(34) transglycosylase Tgt [Chloroflexi bacterium]|nr:tRNA guanosine(34) transglycosylase Tgt [Chloroflexota bacterium]
MSFSFDLQHEDTKTAARLGLLRTPHGHIPTPVFAPVGTQATVKTLAPRDLESLGATLILANTYHLYLRPGPDVVEEMGGLHRFMGWRGPILTDSGGFQVFSMEGLRKVTEDGVAFRSHVDGSEHIFTPEKVMRIQEQLGADIIMCFDECATPTDYAYSKAAMERTHRWAERCKVAHTRPDQALFGIVQGGIFPDLRRQSAEFIAGLGFPGIAIGGLSVGETKQDMYRTLEALEPYLPRRKPRYLMGVGSPEDLLECVARGVDMFDCVLPTRLARNGAVFMRAGRLNLRNAQYTRDPRPIEDGCGCYTCRHFSRAYMRHLVMSDEILGLHLATIHNVHFLLQLMQDIRKAIAEDRFALFKEAFLAEYRVTDEEVRARNRAARGKKRKSSADTPRTRRGKGT